MNEELRNGPVPPLSRAKMRHEPEYSESEQYPTLRDDDTPPIPWLLVPRGMIGYADRKREEILEAGLDRKTKKRDEPQSEVQKWAFITRTGCAFPRINVRQIAEQIVPWDVEVFKLRVAEAEAECREEMAH